MGRLTADPTINDRITCASFNLAVDRNFKQDGQPSADFISCKMLGEKRAEFANKYLRKGTKIIVTGSIQTGSYTNKDGQKVYTTDVIVDSTEFAESKNAIQQNTPNVPNIQNTQSVPQFTPNTSNNGFLNVPVQMEDDLLF